MFKEIRIPIVSEAGRKLEKAKQLAGTDRAALVLVDKLERSRRYAENEMQLRMAFLQASGGWNYYQYNRIEKLLADRRRMFAENENTGTMLVQNQQFW